MEPNWTHDHFDMNLSHWPSLQLINTHFLSPPISSFSSPSSPSRRGWASACPPTGSSWSWGPSASCLLWGFGSSIYLNLFKLVIEVAVSPRAHPPRGGCDLQQLGCLLMLATNQSILGSDSQLFSHLHRSDGAVEAAGWLGTGRHHPQPVSYWCYCSSQIFVI